MAALSDKFFASLQQYGMIAPGDDVLVAFSGGADSVCLLDLLDSYKDQLGIRLRAAHVNHCLRGSESDADEAFARAFCEERGIPLSVLRTDIAKKAKESNKSTEVCAREARYAFFSSLQPDKIATAHTGTDAIETLLMNFSRGASLHGLASIPPVRDNIIRPLISFTREETEMYCKENQLSYVTDSSNLTDDYTRNRIRHHIMPEMRSIRPGFDNSALRCIDSLRTEDDYLRQETMKLLERYKTQNGLTTKDFCELHKALRCRLIAAYIAENTDADFESRHIYDLDENISNEGYTLTLPGATRICVKNSELQVIRELPAVISEEPVRISKHELHDLQYNGFSLRFSVKDGYGGSSFKFNFIDFCKIDDIIEIRTRRQGDRITLAKRNCTKSVKKLFNEEGYPSDLRSLLPVIADSRGVIWIYGAGPDKSRLADTASDKILIIDTESAKNE
jgi:tRNA(Ile)-lysidine synthase